VEELFVELVDVECNPKYFLNGYFDVVFVLKVAGSLSKHQEALKCYLLLVHMYP
jgi:hypothetical protein